MNNKVMGFIKEHFLAFVLLFIAALFFSFATLYFPLSSQTFGHDAGIFSYVGWALTKGKVLYTEVWDNKGPLLYVINMIGVSIHHYYGIYLVELVFFFISLCYAYFTALLLTKKKYLSFVVTIFVFMVLAYVLEGGNLSEEYSNLFNFIGLYYVTKFFLQEYKLKRYEMMIVGACCGAVLLLRLNLLAFFLSMFIVVVYVLIKEKKSRELIEIVSFCLLGFLLFISPFVIYLVQNGAMHKMLDTVYFSVLDNFIVIRKIDAIKSVLSMIDTIRPTGMVIVSIVFILSFVHQLLNKGERDKYFPLYVISIIALFINLYVNSLSGVAQMHYFMSFIPIFLIPCVYIFDEIHTYIERKSIKPFFANLMVVFIVLLLSHSAITQFSWNIVNNIGGKDQETIMLDNYVLTNSGEDDYVQFFKGSRYVTANYRNKRISPSVYFYYAAGIFNSEARTRFATQIAKDNIEKHPKLIIFNDNETKNDFEEHLIDADAWNHFLEENYEQISLGENTIVFKEKA